uniref:Uncharacterized protein n=1 Tax=Panagrellus redivivus TaxID=6233 RepID=A0A7E4VDE1_PANRE
MRILIFATWLLLQILKIHAEKNLYEITDPEKLPQNLKSFVTLKPNGGFYVDIYGSRSIPFEIPLVKQDETLSFKFQTINAANGEICDLRYTICFESTNASDVGECGQNECSLTLLVNEGERSIKGSKNVSVNLDGYTGTQTIDLIGSTFTYTRDDNGANTSMETCPLKVYKSPNDINYVYLKITGPDQKTNLACPPLEFANNLGVWRKAAKNITTTTETEEEEEASVEEKQKHTWIWIVLGMVLIILLLVGILLTGYCLFWVHPCKKKEKLPKKVNPKKTMASSSNQNKQEASSQMQDTKRLKEDKSVQQEAPDPVMQGSDMPPTSEQQSKMKVSGEKTSPIDYNVSTAELVKEKNPYDEILDYTPCPTEMKLFDCRTPKEAIKCLRAEIPAINTALEKLGVQVPATGKVEVTPEIRSRVFDPANPILYRNRLWSLEYPLDLTGTFWDRQCKLIDLSLYRLYALLLQTELSEIAGLQIWATLVHTMSKYLQLMRAQKKKYLHPLPFFYDLASRNPSLFESEELASVWDSAKYRKEHKLHNV